MASPALSRVVLAGIFASAQWTNAPPGASGSIISSASSLVPFGTPDQRSGSETSSGHAYAFGICRPNLNAWLSSTIAGWLV
jgi:hypothetical protein